ncbi:DUF3021 family protein [Micromonospora provocatoris]|uniref:DUF3021 family protein n=1 Tax=Micromonospora provocatoris TaxID=322610 RepID=UPI003D2786D9
MKFFEIVQKIVKDFLIIFASIIIIITILRQIFYPELVFDLISIYIIMAFSFLSALLGLMLYLAHDISETKMRIRIVLHFFSLELLLIALACGLDIVNNATEVIILALQIAFIYILVRLLSWNNDKKEAQKINEKLKAFKKDITQ